MIIGRNVFKREFKSEHPIEQKVKEFLGKNYIKFEQLEDNLVKIGI